MFSPPPVTRWHRRYFCCYCFRWCRCCSAINGVRRLGAVIAALFLNLMPITAVLITAALGVEPTRLQLIGGGLVLAGILLAQLRWRWRWVSVAADLSRGE